MPTATFEPATPSGTLVPSVLSAMGQGQSLMQRAQQMEQARAQEEDRQIKEVLARPLLVASNKANLVKAGTTYDSLLRQQEARAAAYKLYDQASSDFDFVNQITDDKARAAASREWLSRYAQLANVEELKPEMEIKTHLATSNVLDSIKLNMLGGAEARSFEQLTAGMSPEDKEKAVRVKTGLEARPSSAAVKYTQVTGPDGTVSLVAVDPRGVGAQVMGTGERFGTGVNGPGTPEQQAKPNEEGKTVFQSQTPGEKQREISTAEADAKYQSQLRVEKPKRQMALRNAEAITGRLSDEIDTLVQKVSAATAGPGGVILNKFPGTTAKDFESNLNAIKAVIGFQALQAMRESSPTGGALGQVSDFENKLLQSQLGNLEIGQSPSQLIENLKKVKQRVIENFGINRAAYTAQFGEEHTAAPKSDLKNMTTEQLEQRLRELGK